MAVRHFSFLAISLRRRPLALGRSAPPSYGVDGNSTRLERAPLLLWLTIFVCIMRAREPRGELGAQVADFVLAKWWWRRSVGRARVAVAGAAELGGRWQQHPA